VGEHRCASGIPADFSIHLSDQRQLLWSSSDTATVDLTSVVVLNSTFEPGMRCQRDASIAYRHPRSDRGGSLLKQIREDRRTGRRPRRVRLLRSARAHPLTAVDVLPCHLGKDGVQHPLGQFDGRFNFLWCHHMTVTAGSDSPTARAVTEGIPEIPPRSRPSSASCSPALRRWPSPPRAGRVKDGRDHHHREHGSRPGPPRQHCSLAPSEMHMPVGHTPNSCLTPANMTTLSRAPFHRDRSGCARPIHMSAPYS
jgi:hypothetical protein